MTAILFILWAFMVGALIPLQSGINSRLAGAVYHPLQASLVSFTVGTLFLVIINFTQGNLFRWPSLQQLPWWYFTGGLIGTVVVTSVLLLFPRIGAVALLSAVVAGQMMMSVVVDHAGLLGAPEHTLSPGRMLGVLLLVVGVLLIQRF